MYAISIHPSCTFERAGGIDAGFAMLHRAGIEGIQFGLSSTLMPAADIRAHRPSVMDGPLEAIIEAVRPYKEAAQKHGVAISQVHAPYPTWELGDEELNARMPAVMRKSIAVTAYMQSPHCIIHPAFPHQNRDRLSAEEEWEVNRGFYTALIPDLREHHVMALLENMFSRDVEGTRFAAACNDYPEAARWIDDLNDIAGEELFGFCFDTGHCQLARQNIPRAVRILGKRIKALHMQDNSGHLDDHRAPYTGTIDWEAFLASLKAVGYTGDLNFEAMNAIAAYPAALTEDCLRMLAQTGRYFRRRLSE